MQTQAINLQKTTSSETLIPLPFRLFCYGCMISLLITVRSSLFQDLKKIQPKLPKAMHCPRL
uniref:Bm1278 n=1 Tax=Brugia malayi TaxID=6279 RepID=A0A1U7F0S5_BRUMA|nr:Bm1278 [Brugia malayi]